MYLFIYSALISPGRAQILDEIWAKPGPGPVRAHTQTHSQAAGEGGGYTVDLCGPLSPVSATYMMPFKKANGAALSARLSLKCGT